MLFRCRTWMGHGPRSCAADEFRRFPDCAGSVFGGAGPRPCGSPCGKLLVPKCDREFAGDRIDRDDVSCPDRRYGPAVGSFRADVSDAKATRRTRKTTVGDERDLLAHPLARDCSRGGQHLAHARPDCGAFVADHDHLARLVCALGRRLNRFHRGSRGATVRWLSCQRAAAAALTTVSSPPKVTARLQAKLQWKVLPSEKRAPNSSTSVAAAGEGHPDRTQRCGT
jgi:hypothetical protein